MKVPPTNSPLRLSIDKRPYHGMRMNTQLCQSILHAVRRTVLCKMTETDRATKRDTTTLGLQPKSRISLRLTIKLLTANTLLSVSLAYRILRVDGGRILGLEKPTTNYKGLYVFSRQKCFYLASRSTSTKTICAQAWLTIVWRQATQANHTTSSDYVLKAGWGRCCHWA